MFMFFQVILRKDGKIHLYCKGADTVIYERLSPGNQEAKDMTTEHLNVCIYSPFFY